MEGVTFEWVVREQTIRRVLGDYYTLGDRDISHLKEASLGSIDHEREENISNPLWRKVCERLKSSLGKDVHKAWTGKLEYLGDDKEANEDSKLISLRAPSRFIGETIKDRYMHYIREAFEGLGMETEIIMETPV